MIHCKLIIPGLHYLLHCMLLLSVALYSHECQAENRKLAILWKLRHLTPDSPSFYLYRFRLWVGPRSSLHIPRLRNWGPRSQLVSGMLPVRRVKALLSKLLLFGGADTGSWWGNRWEWEPWIWTRWEPSPEADLYAPSCLVHLLPRPLNVRSYMEGSYMRAGYTSAIKIRI